MFKHAIEEVVNFIVELVTKPETWVILFIIGFGVVVAVNVLELPPFWPSFRAFLGQTWWLWLFLLLIPPFVSLWLFWRQSLYKKKLKYILLELRLPREVDKNPKAMEQILSAIHTLRNSPSTNQDKYWKGEHTDAFALEMVSFGGEIHLYVRAHEKFRNIIEASFFSYYKDIEIEEVEDYILNFPKDLREIYNFNQDIWGTEFYLDKEGAYPIKTYADFEASSTKEEARHFDPISVFLEVLGKLKPGETFCVQYVIVPKGKEWKEDAKKIIEELREPQKAADKETTIPKSPGETDVLKVVEKNISKPAFDTVIRLMYLSPKELFHDSHAKGIMAAFNQYSASNLNSFKGNSLAQTKYVSGFFKYPQNKRLDYRKQRLFYKYINRETAPLTFMGKVITSYFWNRDFYTKLSGLNVESLATLFHPPTAIVLTAPRILRESSRKASPPAGLPIYGEEGDIQKFV